MNTIFGASSMFNNQPPAANRQFREDVARLLPCGVHATARNRARPIPFPSRMGPPPHAFRFSAVSPLRGPRRGKQLVRIPRQRLLASFHPSLRRLALARGVVRHVAHYGQVFRREPAPGPRMVLVEDHVEHPVQRILHVSGTRIARAERRRGSMPRRMEGIGCGIGRAATIRCWRLAAGCWWLDIADAKKDSRSVRRGNLF